MTPSRTGRVARLAVVAASTMAAIVLSGCGNTEGPSSSPSSSPPESALPSAAEAQTVEVNGAQLQVPSDWSVKGGGSQRATLSTPANDLGTSTGTGIFNADVTLAENTEALAAVQADAAGGDAKRLPDVKFGGQTFFHYRELHGGVDSLDTYGTVLDGSEVTVAWGFNAKLTTRQEIDEYINQVMPTFRFAG